MYANQEQTQVDYIGFYHLVGRIIEKAERKDYTPLDDKRAVAFTDKNDLLSKDFPQPAIQLDFDAWIPWVLDEATLPDQMLSL